VGCGPGPGVPPAHAHSLAGRDGCGEVCGRGAVGADYGGVGEVDWVEGGAAAVCGVLSYINRRVGASKVCVKLPSLECCLDTV
jgi:hypothetical protein